MYRSGYVTVKVHKRADSRGPRAQLAGAAAVALIVSAGVLLLPDSSELEGAEFLLAALISLIGFAVARNAGASLSRAVVYSLCVLVGAVIIAALKNLLAGH